MEPWDTGCRSLGLPPPPPSARGKLGASNITSKPQHVPSFSHLQHDKLHRWPGAPRQRGSTNEQTDSPPHHSKFSQQGGVCMRVAQHWMRSAIQPSKALWLKHIVSSVEAAK